MELLHLPRAILQTQQVQRLVIQQQIQHLWLNEVMDILGQMVIK